MTDFRQKRTEMMVQYLESQINCKNVMNFVDEHMDVLLGEGKDAVVNKLLVKSVPVAIKVTKYNDTEGYQKKNKGDPRDRAWIENMYKIFDLMTEANYTGFEYFPYLYGVLNCHEEEKSRLYVFYEVFDGDITKLIKQMEHVSEWYDLSFQIIMINYYLEIINDSTYRDGTPQNHLYRKLHHPMVKEYTLDNYQFKINHKYLVVIWDFDRVEKIKDHDKSKMERNTDMLLNYIKQHQEEFPIKPSNRIISLLTKIGENPVNTPAILNEYYNSLPK